MAGLLEVADLTVHHDAEAAAPVVAVRELSLGIDPGEVVGLLGESGSGKSTLLLALLGLLPQTARIVRGSVRLRGRELLGLPDADLRQLRGSEIAYVFQDPGLALNPVRRVGPQVAEVLAAHRGQSRSRSREDALSILADVGLDAAAGIYDAYPHELSGGQRQRVVIAQALACHPALLLADEPTASLDPTTQAELLTLLRSLQARFGLAVLLASHDLGAVAALARRVVVMYAGRLVEGGTAVQVLSSPLHPYTRGLVRAYPRPADGTTSSLPLGAAIPGSPPDPSRLPGGCAFEPRCADRLPVCRDRVPAETAPERDRQVRCVLHGG